MAVTDHIRRRLHSAFVEQYGTDLADALMELLPPAGWGDLVRAGDLAVTRSELRGEMSELRGEMSELRGEMRDLRGELKSEIAYVRSEVSDLRVELKAEMAELRDSQRSMLPKLVLTQVATSISVTGLALGAARFL